MSFATDATGRSISNVALGQIGSRGGLGIRTPGIYQRHEFLDLGTRQRHLRKGVPRGFHVQRFHMHSRDISELGRLCKAFQHVVLQLSWRVLFNICRGSSGFSRERGKAGFERHPNGCIPGPSSRAEPRRATAARRQGRLRPVDSWRARITVTSARGPGGFAELERRLGASLAPAGLSEYKA